MQVSLFAAAVGLNFLVNLLLMMGTNRLSGFPMEPMRCVLGSVVSTVYAVLCIRYEFLMKPVSRVGSLLIVSMTAFGLGRAAVKKTCLFLLLSMALGGIAQNLGRRDLPGLLLGAGLVWLLCVFSFSGAAADREFVPVTLSYRGNTVKLKALRDTGNRLCDPITGEQVLIVSGAVGQKLTGLTPNQLHEPLRTLSQKKLPGLRLIPYRTVGQRNGMLLGVRMNGVMIGKKERNMVVAFDPDGLQADGEVQALLGGNVW